MGLAVGRSFMGVDSRQPARVALAVDDREMAIVEEGETASAAANHGRGADACGPTRPCTGPIRRAAEAVRIEQHRGAMGQHDGRGGAVVDDEGPIARFDVRRTPVSPAVNQPWLLDRSSMITRCHT